MKPQSVLVHSKRYNTDLQQFGMKKPFALDRGERVLQQLRSDLGAHIQATEPSAITHADALLVHTPQYLDSLQHAEVWQEIFELKPDEFTPTPGCKPLNEMFDDIALKCGGTLQAAELALKRGLSANLGGGYHHAFPDRGRGFCVLHDIGIAIRSLQKRGLIKRCLVVDVDFHQGDGTALIFANDPNVFTLSIHSEEGWPEQKQVSTLDVPLRSGETQYYQQRLENAVGEALAVFAPDLVIYVAGSDPYELDVLPGTAFMKMTLEELKRRDRFVIDKFADLNIPLAMVFAGGYGDHVWAVHYWATRRIVERVGLDRKDESTIISASTKT